MVEVLVSRVDDIRPHPDGDRLSIVSVNGHEVVANRHEDGSFRFAPGEIVVYVPENAIVPDDILRERGYWDTDKDKGLLGGSKGNRVKMIRFRGVESRGLVFKTTPGKDHNDADATYVTYDHGGFTARRQVVVGDDVAEFLGIKEYTP